MPGRLLPHLRAHGPALALLGALALVLTWPTAAALGSAIPGHPQSDAYEHLHGYWWVVEELRRGELPLHATQFGLPGGGALWFPDTLGALLWLPVTVLAGAGVAFGLSALAQVWATLAAAYAMGVGLGGGRAGGLLAAAVFGGSSFVLGLVHSGLSEYLHLFPFPLLLLGTLRALEGRGSVAWPALAWGWLGLANGYYVLCGGVVVAAVALSVDAPIHVILKKCISIGAGAAALASPALVATAWTLSQPDSLVRADSAPGWDFVHLPANDLLSFVVPGNNLYPDLRDRGNFGIRHVAYLGIAAIVAAAPGLHRWWRGALLAGLVALGPALHVASKPVRLGKVVLPLPAVILYFPGSPFRSIHHPYRLVVLPMLFLAAAASTLGRRPALASVATGAVILDTLFVSPAAWPLPTAGLEVQATPSPGGRWDFPPEYRDRNRAWLGLQAVHGQPVPYTLNVFLPAPWRGNQVYQSMMACLGDAEVHTVSRDGNPPLRAWLVHDSTQTLEQGIVELRSWGIDYVVVHHDMLDDEERACVASVLGPGEVVKLPG